MAKSKSDLIDEVAARARLSGTRADLLVNCVFDCMAEALQRGEGVEIRGDQVGRGCGFELESLSIEPGCGGQCLSAQRGDDFDQTVKEMANRLIAAFTDHRPRQGA